MCHVCSTDRLASHFCPIFQLKGRCCTFTNLEESARAGPCLIFSRASWNCLVWANTTFPHIQFPASLPDLASIEKPGFWWKSPSSPPQPNNNRVNTIHGGDLILSNISNAHNVIVGEQPRANVPTKLKLVEKEGHLQTRLCLGLLACQSSLCCCQSDPPDTPCQFSLQRFCWNTSQRRGNSCLLVPKQAPEGLIAARLEHDSYAALLQQLSFYRPDCLTPPPPPPPVLFSPDCCCLFHAFYLHLPVSPTPSS